MNDPNDSVYRLSGVADPGDCARCGYQRRTHEDLAAVEVEHHDWVAPNEALIKARMQARRDDRLRREEDAWWRGVVYQVPAEYWT